LGGVDRNRSDPAAFLKFIFKTKIPPPESNARKFAARAHNQVHPRLIVSGSQPATSQARTDDFVMTGQFQEQSNQEQWKENTMATHPTYEQAELQLKIFDLRRESRLRQARDWFNQNFYANTLDEAMRIAPMGTEAGTSFMMVVSYWDQACAYLNHGLLHEDLFFETNDEFFFIWERVKPSIAEGRQRFANPLFLANLEEAAKRYEAWSEKRAPGRIAAMSQMMKQMAPPAGKAA
jgi:hypothetical protein